MAVSHPQRLEITRFVLAVVGICLLGLGGWLHYPPLGYMIAGALLLIVVLIGTWRAR